MHADLIVVGGGIIGLATAYQAALGGASVTLFEKDACGGEQSSRNWGFTRQQYRHIAEIPLARHAIERWANLSDEFGESVSWRRGGNIILADDAGTSARLQAWTRLGRQCGLDTVLLRGEELREAAPFLAAGRAMTDGMYTASDGQADPETAVAAYRRAARRAGVHVIEQTAVRRLITVAGAVVGVRTDEGPQYAARTVIAAGTWTRRLLGPAGARIPIQWVRDSVAATSPLPPITEMGVWGPQCAFRQRIDGSVVFAPSNVTDVDAMVSAIHDLGLFVPLWLRNLSMGFRTRFGAPLLDDLRRGTARAGNFARLEPPPNTVALAAAWRSLREMVPAVREARVVRAWAGYIDGTPDGIPIIGRVPGLAGVVLAAGFSGHGFGIAPAVGEAVADLALGRVPDWDLRPFDLGRFGRRLRPGRLG